MRMLTYVGTATSVFPGFRQVPPNGMWFKCPLLVLCQVLGGNRCYLSLLACSFDDAPIIKRCKMKKTYITPSIEVVKIESHIQILTGSNIPIYYDSQDNEDAL